MELSIQPQKYSFGKIVGWVILGVLVLAALWAVSTYNSLIRLRENVKTQQANVEGQYQRRFDLVPNLEASVRGIFNQERAVFGQLADARARYGGTQPGTPERVAAINQVESSLSRLLVVMENYPQLRSSENVTQLMDELAGTENRIAVERARYNETVNKYNKKIQVFPGSIIANRFDFVAFERFAAQVEAAAPPKVNLEVK